MRKQKKHFRGISFNLDRFFFRNLILIISGVFIWRGMWGIIDFFGHNFFGYGEYSELLNSNLFIADHVFSIIFGIILMYLIDTHLEPPFEEENRRV